MIKKIRTEDLEVGMFIHDFNTPWMNHPFVTRTRLLRKARELDIIREHDIHEVYIDTARGRDSARAYLPVECEPDLHAEMNRPSPPEHPGGDLRVVESPAAEPIPFEEELRKARQVYAEAKETVRGLHGDVRMGKPVDGERAQATVGTMIDSIFRNRDALLSLARLKSYDDYTFQHSLNVAVLSLNLGSHLGILHHELVRLGIGALLHDLGKVFIPERVLNKPAHLTDEEFQLVRTHPVHGAKVMLESKSVPDECASVALNHHERYDGSGYPRALAGMEIGKLGLITAIADVYDAMTTDRVYQRCVPPHVTLKRAFEWAGSLFHPIYVRKFIQCLGIYPTGTAVRLDNGTVGVVWRQNRDQLVKPWVRVCRDSNGAPLSPPVDVDLRHPDPDGPVPAPQQVAEVVDPRPLSIDPDRVLRSPAPEHTPSKLTVVLG